jgi:hypothetical protein
MDAREQPEGRGAPLLPVNEVKTRLGQAVEPYSGLDILSLSEIMFRSKYFDSIENAAQAAVKILAGREMGIGPVAAMRHLYVFRNTIGIQAELMAAKIRESGRYDYEVVESTDERCTLEFFRLLPGGERRSLGRSSFTLEEARKAGLTKKGGPWETWTSDMLFWRAMSRGQRRFCPDVFGQTVYTKEEAEEIAAQAQAAAAAPADKAERPLAIPVSDEERAEIERLAKVLGWNQGKVDHLLGQKGSAPAAIEALRGEVAKLTRPPHERAAESRPARPAPPVEEGPEGQQSWAV